MSRLATFRGIKPAPIEETLLMAELEQSRYTSDQARLAELWILHGDWSYKGKDSRLELADFYPDVRRLQYLLDARKMVLLKRSDYEAVVRSARTNAAAQKAAEVATEPLDQAYVRLSAEIVDLKSKLIDRDDEVSRLTIELAKACRRIERAEVGKG